MTVNQPRQSKSEPVVWRAWLIRAFDIVLACCLGRAKQASTKIVQRTGAPGAVGVSLPMYSVSLLRGVCPPMHSAARFPTDMVPLTVVDAPTQRVDRP